MFDTMIVALMTIAPYNTEAFLALRVLLYVQLHISQMLAFILGASISPTTLR